MKLLVRPFTIAVALTLAWHFFQAGIKLEPDLRKADEGIMTSGVITFLIFVYGLFAVSTFGQAWNNWRTVKKSVRKMDEDLFSETVDDHIPTTARLLLLVGELFLMAAFFLARYESPIDGYFAIFTVTYFLSLVWEVIADFDDYFTGVWNVDIREVPNEWDWAKKNKKKIMAKIWKDVTKGVFPEHVDPR